MTFDQENIAIASANEFLIQVRNQEDNSIANVVRLIFHQCVGSRGCDGCLNVDHSENAGLRSNQGVLYDHYLLIKDQIGMSFADYMNIVAIRAVHMTTLRGSELETINPNMDHTINYGRIDCDTVPYTSDEFEFPSGHGDFTSISNAMRLVAPFTDEQIIALSGGAHSLGRARGQNSGFNGPWDDTKNKLDNLYFQNLAHANLTQEQHTRSGNRVFVQHSV